MGTCFSRSKCRRPPPAGSAEGSRDPPPEETVKEVLSETPRPKPPRPFKGEEDLGIDKETSAEEIGRDEYRSEGTWDASSVSEGFSVSTTATENITKEQRLPLPGSPPVKIQRRRSSSTGEIQLRRRERTADTSVLPVRCRSGISSPSPAKRRESGGRVISVREASKSRENALCRDAKERSRRRSVSPVSKPSGGQSKRALSARDIGRSSPQSATAGNSRTMPAECRDGSAVPGGGKESLENPLVSLECFIFL